MQMKQEKMKGIKLRAIRKDSIFDKMFQIKMMEREENTCYWFVTIY